MKRTHPDAAPGPAGEGGLRFTSGYAPPAACTLSRYAMLTGEYAWRQKSPKVNANTDTELGDDPAPQLFDLGADPGERTNVAAQHPEKVKELQAQLERIRNANRSRP